MLPFVLHSYKILQIVIDVMIVNVPAKSFEMRLIALCMVFAYCQNHPFAHFDQCAWKRLKKCL